MTRTLSPGGTQCTGGPGPQPTTPWRRLGTGGAAVVLAVALSACSGGDAQGPAASGASAETSAQVRSEGEPAGDGAAKQADAKQDGAAKQADAKQDDPKQGDASPAADGAARASAPAEPGAPAVVEDDGTGEEERTTLPVVSLEEAAEPAEGLEITVESTTPVEAEGRGPGGMSGPAIAVVVSVHNSSDAPVTTLGSSVTATYGAEDLPADLSFQADDTALPAEVAPGETVSGTYTFLVPQDQRRDVVITASYRATDPAVVFSGPALGEGARR